MYENDNIESLFSEVDMLSATLSFTEKEKKKSIDDLTEEKDKEIEATREQLFTYYRRAIPLLFKEVLNLMRTVDDTPLVFRLLRRLDVESTEATKHYSLFALLKNSDGTLIHANETYDWFDGANYWNCYGTVITFEQVLNHKETKPEDIVEMYEALKEFVIKYGKKTKKSDGC